MNAKIGRRAKRVLEIHARAAQDAAAKRFKPPDEGSAAGRLEREVYARRFWADFERIRFAAGDYDLL